MLLNVKKYGIVGIMAVLFTLFNFSIVDLIVEKPQYEDYCGFEIAKPFGEREFIDDARTKECYDQFNVANRDHRLIGFIVTSILGVIAILVGLYSKSKEEVLEWVYSGILIGGILSVIFGTMSYFGDMGRFVKPIVLIVEMGLIILVAIRTNKKN